MYLVSYMHTVRSDKTVIHVHVRTHADAHIHTHAQTQTHTHTHTHINNYTYSGISLIGANLGQKKVS